MLGRVRRQRFGSNRPEVNALGLAPRSSSRRDEVPPRSPLQVPLMDDRVRLRRRHLQLGLRLLDKRPLFGAVNLRLRKEEPPGARAPGS
jgi:hypothetical protein